MLARSSTGVSAALSALALPADYSPSAVAGLMSVGVIGQPEDEAPSVVSPAAAVIAPAPPAQATAVSSAAVGRPGLIEIELADGIRLRVDAFVNERALRRVLSVLKAMM